MPKQYQFKKHKNCIVLMQLHLMLKIFVSDGWLARGYFLIILFRILWNDSVGCYTYAKHVLFSHAIVEKEIFIHDIEIFCKQEMFIKSCRHWLFKLTTLRRKIIQRSIFFERDLFRVLVSSVYSRCTPIHGNDVMASGMRHQQKLKKFVEEFNCRYQCV